MTQDTVEAHVTPVAEPQTRTQVSPEAEAVIKFATENHGPIGEATPCRYVTCRMEGNMWVDIYVAPQYGPELKFVVPEYPHAGAPHAPGLFTTDGMLLTYILEDDQPGVVGAGSTFTIAWRFRDHRGWWTTKEPP